MIVFSQSIVRFNAVDLENSVQNLTDVLMANPWLFVGGLVAIFLVFRFLFARPLP